MHDAWAKKMLSNKTKLKVLIENLRINCRYYNGNDYCSRTNGESEFTNCGGDINECEAKEGKE